MRRDIAGVATHRLVTLPFPSFEVADDCGLLVVLVLRGNETDEYAFILPVQGLRELFVKKIRDALRKRYAIEQSGWVT